MQFLRSTLQTEKKLAAESSIASDLSGDATFDEVDLEKKRERKIPG